MSGILDPRPGSILLEDCPQRGKHTPRPFGYVAYSEWAAKKIKTHRQVRCPGCNLWAIWVPRRKAVKP